MGNGNGDKDSITWSKVAQVALPIVLTALIAVLGFLVTQVISLKDEAADLRVETAKSYGDLSKDIALQDFTVRNLSNKIDKIDRIVEIKVLGRPTL